jgi:hypothetical protein
MSFSIEAAVQIAAMLSLVFAIGGGLALGVHYASREASVGARITLIAIGFLGLFFSISSMCEAGAPIHVEVDAIILVLSTLVAFTGIGMIIAFRKAN